MAACEIQGCTRPRRKRTWCNTHYEMWRRHGDPLYVRPSWRLERPGYKAAHNRVKRERGPASGYRCADCGAPANEWSYDGRDENELVDNGRGRPERYSLDTAHYQPRCFSCHRSLDARSKTRSASADVNDTAA